MLTILYNYKLDNTFNADKLGLSYQSVSNKTNNLSGEECSGGKTSVTEGEFRMFVFTKL